MSFTLDQMTERVREKLPSLGFPDEELTEEGVRFAVAVMVADIQESPQWAQDKALRERTREIMEAWMV